MIRSIAHLWFSWRIPTRKNSYKGMFCPFDIPRTWPSYGTSFASNVVLNGPGQCGFFGISFFRFSSGCGGGVEREDGRVVAVRCWWTCDAIIPSRCSCKGHGTVCVPSCELVWRRPRRRRLGAHPGHENKQRWVDYDGTRTQYPGWQVAPSCPIYCPRCWAQSRPCGLLRGLGKGFQGSDHIAWNGLDKAEHVLWR